jgi:hypothetical protein
MPFFARLRGTCHDLATRIWGPLGFEDGGIVTRIRRVVVTLPEIWEAQGSLGDEHPVVPYQSSSVVERGSESARAGRHRRTSFTIACMYGRLRASENVGVRDRPTTMSSSACARLCTSGCVTIANFHQFIVVDVVSAPAALSEDTVQRGVSRKIRKDAQ